MMNSPASRTRFGRGMRRFTEYRPMRHGAKRRQYINQAQLAAADLEAARLRESLISRGTQKRDSKARRPRSPLICRRLDEPYQRPGRSSFQTSGISPRPRSSAGTSFNHVPGESRGRCGRRAIASTAPSVRRTKPATDRGTPPERRTHRDRRPACCAGDIVRGFSGAAAADGSGRTSSRTAGRHRGERHQYSRTTRVAPLSRFKQELETAMCSRPDDWTLRHESPRPS